MTPLSKYLPPLLLVGLSAMTAQADCGPGTNNTAAVQPHAAYHVAALDEVNDTDARRSIGTAVDDSVITGKVKAALVGAEDIDAMKINVDTRNGVVDLDGSVKTDAESQLAEKLAADVDGVTSVVNRLAVTR